MKWTHLNAHTHSLPLSLTNTHKHTFTRTRTQTHTCVCVCIKSRDASIDDPHPQHQTQAPAQVMGVLARGHRMPLAQRLLCRPRALRLLFFLFPFSSSPFHRAAHSMSHQTAHQTTQIDSPLVHESQRSRPCASWHILMCVTCRWQQKDSNLQSCNVETQGTTFSHAASAHVLRCISPLSADVHESSSVADRRARREVRRKAARTLRHPSLPVGNIKILAQGGSARNKSPALPPPLQKELVDLFEYNGFSDRFAMLPAKYGLMIWE
jgi:hypothetical protein